MKPISESVLGDISGFYSEDGVIKSFNLKDISISLSTKMNSLLFIPPINRTKQYTEQEIKDRKNEVSN